MPYSKSRARKSFEFEIDKMISVIKVTFSNKSLPSDTKNYVLSCAIMLGSAKMEVYIEDVFEGWIRKVNNAGLTSSHLPPNLIAVYLTQPNTINAFKKLIIDNNESQFIDLIVPQLNDNHFHLIDRNKNIPNLISRKIYQ